MNRRQNYATAPGGFTLVELLVAVAVLAITMMLTYGVYASMFSVIDHVQHGGYAKRSALLFFDQLQRDVYGMYKGPSGYFVAEEPLNLESGAPFLQFVTSSRLDFEDRPMRPALVHVRYTLEKTGNKSIFNLYRTEIPFLFSGLSATNKVPKMLRVGAGISSLSLRYQGSDELFFDRWEMRVRGDNGSFDDRRFPALISVELGYAGGDGSKTRPQFFRSSSRVPVAGLSVAGTNNEG